MGVLPLQFKAGENAETLGLTGRESFDVQIDEKVRPRDIITVTATDEDGNKKTFEVLVRFDSEVEIDYYRHGGILQMVLRDKLKA
ncbi:aconitate hydratase [Mesobacillus boroniphilus JCM 21738]|uniref:Aconitate hydratase A n=1 Tax=Mesobacillus boroniphilus JCM 21738 TaxID=1294265 RepID=W4RMC2_9BACI|nr:aconitate hydratase [Mesobacillus boroniphilus JCM 21738]